MDKFNKFISEARTIVLASHLNPDGDNLGSLLGMYSFFKDKKEVYAIEDDILPENLKFLPNIKFLKKSDEIKIKPDLFITLDCGDEDRIGESAKKIFKSAKKTINIDHHRTNTNFADLNIVDPKAPATGEILYELLSQMGSLDIDTATCLFTAISSDTGSFKYDSVRERTFEVAGKLLSLGIDLNQITINLFQSRSVEKTSLLVLSVKNILYLQNGKAAIVKVTDEDMLNTGAKKSDADGIVEFVRDIEGVELAVLLKEKGKDTRISTRSKKYIDCTKIVGHFEGGGHIRAAGGTIRLPIIEAEKEVIKVIDEEFKCLEF